MSNQNSSAPEVLNEYVNNQELSDAFSDKAQDQLTSSQIEAEQAYQNEEEISETEEAAQPEEDKFSSKFAALSRKEKAIRQRESQLEQRYAELESKLAALEKPAEPAAPEEEPLDQLLRRNPMEALKKFGWDYDKITQMTLEDGKLPADMQLQLMREEMERSYNSKLEQLEKQLEEDRTQRENEKYQKVVNKFMTELNEFVDTNGENYEFIKANDATDLVYEVIEEHYEESGRILDKKEAADLVEQYLEEEFRQKIAKTSKAKKFLAPQQETEPQTPQRQSSPTLSNAHSATASPKAERRLSEDESRAKAASLLKWTE